MGSKLVKLVRLRYLDDVPLCLETTYLPPSFESLIDRDINGSLSPRCARNSIVRRRRGIDLEVCYASQNEAFLLNVERGQALILITDYVYDTDGRPLHISKRIQRTDRAKYTEPIGQIRLVLDPRQKVYSLSSNRSQTDPNRSQIKPIRIKRRVNPYFSRWIDATKRPK